MILVFSGSVTLPRTFLQEEENRSADFWRLVARPESVFYGKALFNIVQMFFATVLITVAFVITIRMDVKDWGALVLNAVGGSIAIASTATLSGAIVAPATNRFALASAISAPMLCFLVNLGVTGTGYALGEGLSGGNLSFLAMISYGIAATLWGPMVYLNVWKS
jgi:heme exporter protein B